MHFFRGNSALNARENIRVFRNIFKNFSFSEIPLPVFVRQECLLKIACQGESVLHWAFMGKKMGSSLGPIYLVIFLDMLGFGTIIPVIRDMTIEMARNFSWYDNASPEILAGILMTAYSASQFLTSPLFGRLSDKYGRRPLLMASVFGNVASYALWAVSQSFEVFLASRVVSGITGGNINVAQAYIADVTERDNRAKAMGMMGAIFGLGFIMGPFVGALLSSIDLSSWQNSIPLNRFSAIGIFSMVLSAVNLLWISVALIEPERLKSQGQKVSLGLVALLQSIRQSNLARLLVVYFLSQLAFVFMEATLAWHLKDAYQMDTAATGYFFAFMGVIMVLVQGGVYRPLVSRLKERKMIWQGLPVAGIALIILPFTATFWMGAIIIAMLAYGMGVSNPSQTSLGSLYSSEEDQGLNLGIMQGLGALARILAPVFATTMYVFWHPAPYMLAGVLTLIALGVSVSLPKPLAVKE